MRKWPKNKVVRTLLRTVLFVVALALGWFALNRMLSPFRAVRLVKMGVPPADGALFSRRLRIGTYNIAHGRGTATSNWEATDRATHLDRCRQIAQRLKPHDLDVLVLNEVDFDSAWSGGVAPGMGANS